MSQKNNLKQLAARATETFQHCDATHSEEDRCDLCERAVQEHLVALDAAVPMAAVGSGNILHLGSGEQVVVDRTTKFAGGGFSTIFASTAAVTPPRRGVSRLHHHCATPNRGVILKCSDPTDPDVSRPHLIETVIAQELQALPPSSTLAAPIGGMFKLPMAQLEPQYLYATAYPRYDGDLLELLQAGMLDSSRMFHAFAVVASTLATLQDRLKFQHRDLKFENIFFQYSPSSERRVEHRGMAITTQDVFFNPIIGDFGMSSALIDGVQYGSDFWGSSVDTFVPGGDLCFLAMCLLSSDGHVLRDEAVRFHRFLWRLAQANPVVQHGIYAMREGEGDPQQSDSECEDDDRVELTMDSLNIQPRNYDRAMYIITNSPKVDLSMFEPVSVLDALAGQDLASSG